jgi:hypothetical protein
MRKKRHLKIILSKIKKLKSLSNSNFLKPLKLKDTLETYKLKRVTLQILIIFINENKVSIKLLPPEIGLEGKMAI